MTHLVAILGLTADLDGDLIPACSPPSPARPRWRRVPGAARRRRWLSGFGARRAGIDFEIKAFAREGACSPPWRWIPPRSIQRWFSVSVQSLVNWRARGTGS